MRTFLSLLLVLIMTLGFINLAEAKRFGGGRSFGVTHSSSYAKSGAVKQSLSSYKSSASRWLGPLAGLATGGLLAYLLMGHGLGSGILSWLVIGGILLFLARLLFNRPQPLATQSAYQQAPPPEGNIYNATPVNSTSYSSRSIADFDEDAFIRDMKVQFIRLQAAYDAKNLSDIREVTTPEVYAEVQMQLQERGETPNITEVVQLNAELLGAEAKLYGDIAEIKFSGLIREEKDAPASAFSEVWHFSRADKNSRWLIAGIEQKC